MGQPERDHARSVDRPARLQVVPRLEGVELHAPGRLVRPVRGPVGAARRVPDLRRGCAAASTRSTRRRRPLRRGSQRTAPVLLNTQTRQRLVPGRHRPAAGSIPTTGDTAFVDRRPRPYRDRRPAPPAVVARTSACRDLPGRALPLRGPERPQRLRLLLLGDGQGLDRPARRHRRPRHARRAGGRALGDRAGRRRRRRSATGARPRRRASTSCRTRTAAARSGT